MKTAAGLPRKKKVELNFKHRAEPGLISVIIPVYNDALGLNETLLSLDKQSLANSKYEIIVANDGGDSKVAELCQNRGLLMIEIIPNSGSYYARNRAIELARGEFLAFVDADIKVPPDWLKIGLDQLQTADYIAGEVKIDSSAVKSAAHYFDLKTSFPMKMYLEKYHFGGAGNLFTSREVFATLGGFNEKLISGGDNEFGNRVYHNSEFKQAYCERLVIMHPPRSFFEQVRKKSRTSLGMITLSRLYPDRYPQEEYNSPGTWLRLFMPCTASTLSSVTGKIATPRFIYYFFYCWLLKIFSGLEQAVNLGSTRKKIQKTTKPQVKIYNWQQP